MTYLEIVTPTYFGGSDHYTKITFLMKPNNDQKLIPQGAYAKTLRPLLPAEAFVPNPNKLFILFINLAILILGWTIATKLVFWQL